MERPRTALGMILISLGDAAELAPAPELGPAPDLDPLLQSAIAAGVMSVGQARDLDAFADGLLARVREGEITPEQGDEMCVRRAISDAEASNRARERIEHADRPAGSHVEGMRQTVPFDPTWAERNEDVRGATVRQVRLAALRANERGYTAATLRARGNYYAPTFPAALIRTAIKWGLIQ